MEPQVTITVKNNTRHVSKIKTYASSKFISDILLEEDSADRQILIDGSSSITRIASDDPITKYFGGREGDIFRIVDERSMRYRIVYNLTDKNTARDVKKTIAPLLPAEMFKRAGNTLRELYADRGYTYTDLGNVSDVENIRLKGHKGERQLYTVTVPLDFMKKNLQGLFKDEALMEIIEAVQKDVPGLAEFNYEKIEQSCAEYAKYVNIIVIYDNPQKVALPVRVKCAGNLLLQFLAIQQLQFNISKHVLQPKMTLLDRVDDREEIIALYQLNGIVLDPSKTLADYNLCQDSKLIII